MKSLLRLIFKKQLYLYLNKSSYLASVLEIANFKIYLYFFNLQTPFKLPNEIKGTGSVTLNQSYFF